LKNITLIINVKTENHSYNQNIRTFDRSFVNIARRFRRESWLVRLIDLMRRSHCDCTEQLSHLSVLWPLCSLFWWCELQFAKPYFGDQAKTKPFYRVRILEKNRSLTNFKTRSAGPGKPFYNTAMLYIGTLTVVN
jgi:hypothetical protein